MFAEKLFALTAFWAPVGAIDGYFWFRHTSHLLLPLESTILNIILIILCYLYSFW
jgi:hypothetical protein